MAIPRDKLPRNIEAEKATLGGMLESSEIKDLALADLKLSDFYLEIHQKIFDAIFSLSDKNIQVDIQTVTQELKNMKVLDEIGGVDYLYELTQSMLSENNAKEYIAIIKDNANLRSLLISFGEIENDYLKKDIDSYASFVAEAQRKVDKIAEERRISNFKSSREVVDEVSNRIFELSESTKDDALTGVDTGFKKLNYYTNGLQQENLIIVAGRTGLGKTAFALNLLLNAAKTGVPVGIFEMEMSSLTLYSRLVSNDADVRGKRILNGQIRGRECVRVKESLERLANLKIYVDESSSLTIYDLVAKARKLKSEQPDLGLLVIDYLGLIATDNKRKNRKFDSRQLEIQEYTRTLHELARELHIPIVVLCQLNRKVEDRSEGGTPRLSDLRESGSIEQDAEIVLLLHSSDYGKNEINRENEQKKKTSAANMSDEKRRALLDEVTKRAIKENSTSSHQDNEERNVTIMNVIIAKNRNGASDGVVRLMFEKEYSRFSDLSDEYIQKEKAINEQYKNQED